MLQQRMTNVSEVADERQASAWEMTATQTRRWVFLIILAVGVFYVTTIRPGHNWGDDFGMYVGHARNLVEGRPYAETGYIYNPLKDIGPLTYPPVYPWLLAPVYQVWGLHLTAMKVEIVLIFLLALGAIYLVFRPWLPPPYLIALVALIGFNPQLWVFKDNLVSDLPFLLFTYLSFYFAHQVARPEQTRAARIAAVLLLGLAVVLACGTRIVGVVLAPCLLIYYLLQTNRLKRLKWQSGLGLLLLLSAAWLFLRTQSWPLGSAYASHLGINALPVVLVHSRELLQYLSEYWVNGYSKVFRFLLFVLLSGLAVVGYGTRLRNKQLTCCELFIPFYPIPLIILPIEVVARFLLPLIPLYLFYAFVGFQRLAARARSQRVEQFACAGLLLALFGSYAGQYTRLEYGPIHDGVTKREAQELFAYVEREVGAREVVIFRKPRALSVFTRRPAAAWHNTITDEELWAFFRRVNAAYLIVGPAEIEPGDQWFIREFVERNRTQLQETFVNADFRVYRIGKAAT
jgi:4-amino-4-deoxy-L-arabinose transferase-like glycosyltransferase